MKKVFLAVLAAGLFFACGNDTKDQKKTDEETNKTEVEAPAAEETEATEAETTTAPEAEATEQKNETAEIIEASADAAATTINAVSEASKASKGRGK